MGNTAQYRLQSIADRAAARTYDSTRHKCFISHHAADRDEVVEFLDAFGTEFIGKTIGVTDEDDFIDSDDADYVTSQIRTKYLGDSSVTIVLMGQCTWARRYVDWEVYSSLRNSKHSTVNGLLAIQLPSVAQSGTTLQARVNDNVTRDANDNDIGYARWYVYPHSTATLRAWINDAYSARTTRAHLINNTRPRRRHSSTCP